MDKTEKQNLFLSFCKNGVWVVLMCFPGGLRRLNTAEDTWAQAAPRWAQVNTGLVPGTALGAPRMTMQVTATSPCSVCRNQGIQRHL